MVMTCTPRGPTALWILHIDQTTSVNPPPARNRLHFALAGQPVRDAARFRFDVPKAASVAIDVFDLAGRRAADRIAGFWSAGPHELTVDERGLRPGVYAARLTTRRHARDRSTRARAIAATHPSTTRSSR
jgi:hypothetical protein